MRNWLLLSVGIVLIDQITKEMARSMLIPYDAVPVAPFFNLTLVFNTGAAFSFLAGAGGWQRWLFAILAASISVVIVFWLRRCGSGDRFTAFSLALILGGAVGNLIDRVAFGHVTDFLDVYYRHWHWPAFNVADSAITVGAVSLVVESLWPRRSTSSG